MLNWKRKNKKQEMYISKLSLCLILCLLLGNSTFSQPVWTQLGRLAAGDTVSINKIPYGDTSGGKKKTATVRIALANGDSGAFVADADIKLLNQLISECDWQNSEIHCLNEEAGIFIERINNYEAIVSKMRNDSTIFQGIVTAQDEKNDICKKEVNAEKNKNKFLKGLCWIEGGAIVVCAAVAAAFIALTVLTH